MTPRSAAEHVAATERALAAALEDGADAMTLEALYAEHRDAEAELAAAMVGAA